MLQPVKLENDPNSYVPNKYLIRMLSIAINTEVFQTTSLDLQSSLFLDQIMKLVTKLNVYIDILLFTIRKEVEYTTSIKISGITVNFFFKNSLKFKELFQF